MSDRKTGSRLTALLLVLMLVFPLVLTSQGNAYGSSRTDAHATGLVT